MEEKGEIVLSKKRQHTSQRIIKAVKETKGLLTAAAPRAGVSYRTISRYANEFPSVKKAIIEAKEEMKDFAENQLHKAIKDSNLTAILFYLKTQAKDRGYIEKTEVKAEVEHKGELKVVSMEDTIKKYKKVLDKISEE